jgi:hypothetical protein
MIENLHFRTHQDLFADVSGNTVRDYFVLINIGSRPSLHLEDHIVPPVLTTFQVYLEFAADFWNLGQNMVNLARIYIHGPEYEHVI